MTNLARQLSPTATRSLRLISMTDETERRDTPTDLAPGLPAGHDTQPPPAIPRAARVPQLSDRMRDQSIDQLLRMYQAAQDRESDLLDADGKLARLNDERADRIKTETIRELSIVVDQIAGAPVRELSRKISDLAGVVGKVKGEVEQLEQQVKDMRAELTQLRGRVDAQELDLKATNELLGGLEKRWNDEHDARAAKAPNSPG